MILGVDVSTTILIALIPVTFTMVCGLMAWIVKNLAKLTESANQYDYRLKLIEERQKEVLERLDDYRR